MKREDIARIAHEVNRAYCLALGDLSQPAWEDAPDWQKKSARTGVDLHLDNPDASPSASHESWLAEKERDGWVYGPVKDPAAKQHPCMVPFAELPVEQQAKDYLFREVVHLASQLDVAPRPACAVRLREPNGVTPRGLTCDTCGAKSNGEPVQCKG